MTIGFNNVEVTCDHAEQFRRVVGAKVRGSSRIKEKKINDSEYKQLLKGNPEWSCRGRGSMRSREGFFC